MKMNKKAFTLVELLAVIVILGILALIAVPIVLNIVNSSKESSVKASVQNYARAVDIALYNYNVRENMKPNTCKVVLKKDKSYIKCDGYDEEILIDVKADKPTDGILTFKDKEVDDYELYIDGYVCSKKEEIECIKATKTNITITEPLTTITDNKSTILNSYKIYGNSVQDGTPDPENPIEIKNVGDLITDINDPNYAKYEIKIKVVGKNLFDNRLSYKDLTTKITSKEDLKKGLKQGQRIFYGISTGGGSVGDEIKYSRNNETFVLLPINNNETYTIKKSYIKQYITALDENFVILGSFGNSEETTFSNIIGAKYLFVYVSNTAHVADGRQPYTLQDILDNLQIELGDTTTEYEPYREKSYSIYLNEPLRCVKDVCDYIDLEKGQVVRKIHKYVFTGTEKLSGGFTTAPTGDLGWGGTNTTGFYQYIKNSENSGLHLFGEYYSSNSNNSLNNYFPYYKYGVYNYDKQSERISGSNYYAMRINRSILEQYGSDNSTSEVNITAFKSFLKDKYDSGNPVYVLYELADYIYEDIEIPTMELNEDISNIIIDTETTPSKIELEYYK